MTHDEKKHVLGAFMRSFAKLGVPPLIAAIYMKVFADELGFSEKETVKLMHAITTDHLLKVFAREVELKKSAADTTQGILSKLRITK